MNHTTSERHSLKKSRIALNNYILRTMLKGGIDAARESTYPTVQELRNALVGNLETPCAESFPAIVRWLTEIFAGGAGATIWNAD
jgi:hypothetical protein